MNLIYELGPVSIDKWADATRNGIDFVIQIFAQLSWLSRKSMMFNI